MAVDIHRWYLDTIACKMVSLNLDGHVNKGPCVTDAKNGFVHIIRFSDFLFRFPVCPYCNS